MERRKIFVIGLDGATFDVILPLVKRNELPNFKRLMDNGAWGELESTIPPLSGPAWTSFMTGMKPVNHGIFDFIIKKPGSYETFYINSTHIKARPFWDILGDYGLKVGIINIMVTYPPHPVNGFLITGGLTPSSRNFTYPKSLANEIIEKFGYYPILPVGGLTTSERDEEKFVKTFFSSEEKRMNIARYLMNNKYWDFFVVMFEASDPLQHVLWKYLKKEDYPCNLNQKDYVKYAIPNYYKKIDVFLGEMLDRFGKEVNICVLSDHGFASLKSYFIVNNWLMKIGLLKLKNNFVTNLKKFAFYNNLNIERFYRLARNLGISRVISFFRGGPPEKALNRLTLSFDDIDWNQTKAFAMGTGGHIYINVKGREPKGIVNPDREYEETRKFIIQRLEHLIDPKTGKNVVEKIYKKEQIHNGKFSDQAPDIIFLTSLDYATLHKEQFVSPSIFLDSPNSGTHRMHGILIFHGPLIKKRIIFKDAKIYDIAPTILKAFNLHVPGNFDGRILKEIFL